jgi:hypothetical protein
MHSYTRVVSTEIYPLERPASAGAHRSTKRSSEQGEDAEEHIITRLAMTRPSSARSLPRQRNAVAGGRLSHSATAVGQVGAIANTEGRRPAALSQRQSPPRATLTRPRSPSGAASGSGDFRSRIELIAQIYGVGFTTGLDKSFAPGGNAALLNYFSYVCEASHRSRGLWLCASRIARRGRTYAFRAAPAAHVRVTRARATRPCSLRPVPSQGATTGFSCELDTTPARRVAVAGPPASEPAQIGDKVKETNPVTACLGSLTIFINVFSSASAVDVRRDRRRRRSQPLQGPRRRPRRR